MKPLIALAAAMAALAPTASAQRFWYPKHSFRLGLGSAQPRADLRNLYKDSFNLGFGYGYRFHPYFQADIGLDTAFGAAGVRDFLPTVFGDLRIRDYQFLMPVGGRAILPLARDRVHLFGGGGGAYMRYTERIRQPGDYIRIDCTVCASRHGWGYYALAGVSTALDRNGHFRLGVSGRVYRGHTDGDPLGAVSGIRTRDHWVHIGGDFTFSF